MASPLSKREIISHRRSTIEIAPPFYPFFSSSLATTLGLFEYPSETSSPGTAATHPEPVCEFFSSFSSRRVSRRFLHSELVLREPEQVMPARDLSHPFARRPRAERLSCASCRCTLRSRHFFSAFIHLLTVFLFQFRK